SELQQSELHKTFAEKQLKFFTLLEIRIIFSNLELSNSKLIFDVFIFQPEFFGICLILATGINLRSAIYRTNRYFFARILAWLGSMG
ncbi:MAG TPA: hypothetical protein PL123_13365, partial [Bacteroidales bacterium]|nr:hypothetical protein [Bacteroidales bacterium]